MKMTAKQFRQWPNKSITLLGMSGVGKTTFSSKLPASAWFHYSGDYRIGTRYLDEPILDSIKAQAMKNGALKDLLRKDSIYIRNNITIDHLQPISDFLGKIGNPELGGLSVEEFKRRQSLFKDAEVKAMADVREFMVKSREVYNYPHFINDAGGSICGLSNQMCWNELTELSVILYLKASDEMETTLLERAVKKPKPLFYESEFLDRHLALYLSEQQLDCVEQIVPDEFGQWVFPRLIEYRKPQYENIAAELGYTIDAEKILESRDEQDIIDLICDSMEN